MHETVAVPEPAMLAGVIMLQLKLEGRPSDKLTVPVKPFTATIVRVETEEEPTLTSTGGVASIV